MILRVQQQGFVRASGYQATEWAVTVPVSVPGGSAPLATTPSSYAPLFVVDTSGPREVLRRVAALRDYEQYDRAECDVFEPKTPGTGYLLLSSAVAGDTLRITPGPDHWLQPQAPYDTHDFLVSAVPLLVSGSPPQTYIGNRVSLPGHILSDADVGRWVKLSGFTASPSYNGWAQIVSYEGSVATVSRTFTTMETGGNWEFFYVKISDQLSFGGEPRYFPTKAANLGWQLVRGGSPIASGAGGGCTRRDTSDPVVRSVRWTELSPTPDGARAVFSSTAAQLAALQRSSAAIGTEFTALATLTEGP